MSGDRGSLCGLVWFGKTFFKSFAFLYFVLCGLVYNILLIVLHYNLQFLYLFLFG